MLPTGVPHTITASGKTLVAPGMHARTQMPAVVQGCRMLWRRERRQASKAGPVTAGSH